MQEWPSLDNCAELEPFASGGFALLSVRPPKLFKHKPILVQTLLGLSFYRYNAYYPLFAPGNAFASASLV